MSSSTITSPINIPPSSHGSKSIGGLSSTSPRHPLPGSTPSRSSLSSPHGSVLSAAYSDHCDEMKDAIHRFLDHTNANSKAFYLDHGSKPRPRRCQTRAANVSVNPLEHQIVSEQMENHGEFYSGDLEWRGQADLERAVMERLGSNPAESTVRLLIKKPLEAWRRQRRRQHRG